MENYRFSIGLKITLLVCASALISGIAGIIIGDTCMVRPLVVTAGENNRASAGMLASSVALIIERETGLAKENAGYGALRNAVKEAQANYGRSEKSARRYLANMEKEWGAASEDLTKEYLENAASMRLKSIMAGRKNITEIVVTDKFGGLVAATARVSGFSQGAMDWWQEAYASGRGKSCIGDAVFSKASGVWTVPITVPVTDEETGEAIGVFREFIDISVFFNPLRDFKAGNTGYAVLVDGKGYLVYQHGSVPFGNKFCKYKDLQKALQNKTGWQMLEGVYLHAGKVLVAYEKVAKPVFLNRDMDWWIFIVQDPKEIFMPLSGFISRMWVFLAVFIILIIISIRVAFIKLFLGPIVALNKEVDECRQAKEKLRQAEAHLIQKEESLKQTEARLRQAEARLRQAEDGLKQVEVRMLRKEENLKQAEANMGQAEEKLRQTEEDLAQAKGNLGQMEGKLKQAEETRARIEEKLTQTEAKLGQVAGERQKALDSINEMASGIEKKDEKLSRSTRLLADFVSAISRLRSSIIAADQGIKSFITPKPLAVIDEKHKKPVITAEMDISGMMKCLDNLVDMARIEEGRIELNMGLVDIKSVIRHMIFTFEPRIREKGLDLKHDISMVRMDILADAGRIKKVIEILLENAIKYTEKGYIGITVKDLKNTIECSISDTGIGISADDIPAIFEPFKPLGVLAESAPHGIGVGLAIAKGIIELHNGKIWVESEPGKFTRFSFILPKKT